MSSNFNLFVILLFIFTICGLPLCSQVTIGMGEPPAKYATLHVKTQAEDSKNPDGPTTGINGGGILLPRVQLSKKKELLPFATQAEVAANGQDYQAAKKSHTGLIVYNLIEDDDEELCRGLNQWDGKQWNCFETKMGNAVFDEVKCSDIVIRGNYVEGKETGESHRLDINLNVTKPGMFSFFATTTNGYGFFLKNIILNTGRQTVHVPCQGTPIAQGTDQLAITGIPLESGCTPEVTVQTSIAVYQINCSNVIVNGTYVKGTPLTSTNKITLTVNVSTPGSYLITTPKTNGVSFSSRMDGNEWTTPGIKKVTLYPDPQDNTNAPGINSDFDIEINTNTPLGNNKCMATIPMTLPPMTYAIIGAASNYSWNNQYRKSAFNNQALGPNGIVKVQNLTQVGGPLGTNIYDQAAAQQYLNNLINAINNPGGTFKIPDIILYFAYGAAPNASISGNLATYVNNGGVVIYGAADDTANEINLMLNGIFGSGQGKAVNTVTSCNRNDYLINPAIPNDPIINGPFGNIAGKYWMEDNYGTVYCQALPPNSVQICAMNSGYQSPNIHPEASVVWYNNNKNFVFFGDCVAAYDQTSTENYGWPAIYESGTGLPKTKKCGRVTSGTDGQGFVYNAALELNCVAWALKKAAVSGINPH